MQTTRPTGTDALTLETLERFRAATIGDSTTYRVRYAHGIGEFGPTFPALDVSGVVSVVEGTARTILWHTLETTAGHLRESIRVLSVETIGGAL